MNNEENKSFGKVQIADEVVAVIASTAAAEVEGVTLAPIAATDQVAGFFGKRNQAKGVKVTITDEGVTANVEISVSFGAKLIDAATEVQSKVKNAIETMTGLTVLSVNVNVIGLTPEVKKEPAENE